MTWTADGHVPGAPLAIGGARMDGGWVMRGMAALFAARDGAGELAWSRNLDAGGPRVGPRLVAVADGVAVTVEDRGADSPARVLGFDAAGGEPRWERELALRPGTFGLAALEDRVYVQGGEPGADGIVFALAAADGAVGEPVRLADGNGVRTVDGTVYAPTQRGVFALSPAGGEPRQVTAVSARMMHGGEGGLLLQEYDRFDGSVPALVWVDAESGEERGRFDAHPSLKAPTQLVPLSAGRALVVADAGTVIVDLAAGSVVAPLELPEGGVAVAAVHTPHGLVVLLEDASYRQSVATFDPATGRQTGTIPVQGTLRQASLFAADDALLVSGAGAQLFTWREG
jgi:outer membrane protein assembly factor BamB